MSFNISGQHAARRLLQLQRMQRKLRARRLDARLPVALVYQGRRFPCMTENVSISGLFLRAAEAPPDGAEVEIHLTLPQEARALVFQGRVVRLTAKEGDQHGVGVHLHELDRESYRDWSRFLALLGKSRDQFPGAPRLPPASLGDATHPPRARPQAIVRVEIQLNSVEEMFDVLRRDISVGGLFVRLATPPAPGSPALLTFVHPLNQSRYGFTGKINYTISEPADERGAGIYFDDCTYEQQDEFLRFIEDGLPEISPLEWAPGAAEAAG